MTHPLRNLSSALGHAADRFVLWTIASVPQYLRYRVDQVLHAAELRRVRRRRLALAGGSVVVALGVIALRSAKHDDDH